MGIRHSIDNPSAYIAESIVQLRENAGLTQTQVAARLQTMGINYTRGRISMIENKQRPAPHLLLAGLKIIFGCSYSDFYSSLEEKVLEEQK